MIRALILFSVVALAGYWLHLHAMFAAAVPALLVCTWIMGAMLIIAYLGAWAQKRQTVKRRGTQELRDEMARTIRAEVEREMRAGTVKQ